jgi:hypothetical protein
MQGGQTRDIQLLVIGTGSERATFSADLPSFAKLVGSVLTLSPKRADEGQYVVTVTAIVGDESARTTMQVVVRSPNTPPSWMMNPIAAGGILLGDDAGIYGPGPMVGGCPGASCELKGLPSIYASTVCDQEDDPVTVDVEIVPLGQPFTKTPTHSRTGQVGVNNGGPRCQTAFEHCSCFQVPADGLARGTTYAFAVRLTDARGAVTTSRDAPDGWVSQPSFLQFKTAP